MRFTIKSQIGKLDTRTNTTIKKIQKNTNEIKPHAPTNTNTNTA